MAASWLDKVIGRLSGAAEGTIVQERPQEEQQDIEAEIRHRKTEQGDELTEEHSIAQRENRAKNPYRPPRQPSQDRPGTPEEERELQRRRGAF